MLAALTKVPPKRAEDQRLWWQELFSAADMYVRRYWGQHTGRAASAAPAAARPTPKQALSFINALVVRAGSTIAGDSEQRPQTCRQLLQLCQAALRAGCWQALHREVYLSMYPRLEGSNGISTEQLCEGGDGSILALLCSCLRLSLEAAAASKAPHNSRQVAQVCGHYATLLWLVAKRGHAAATAAQLDQAAFPHLLLEQLSAQPFQPTPTMLSCLLEVLPHTCFLISASVHQQPGALEHVRLLVEVGATDSCGLAGATFGWRVFTSSKVGQQLWASLPLHLNMLAFAAGPDHTGPGWAGAGEAAAAAAAAVGFSSAARAAGHHSSGQLWLRVPARAAGLDVQLKVAQMG